MIFLDVTVMSSMDLSASVAFVGSSWWTELCLCRGATEVDSGLECLRSVESFFVLGLEVRSFEATSRISSR